MKKVFVGVLVACLLILSISLLIPKLDEEPVGSVELSVNPNVEFIINKDSKVINILYKNGDAEVLLSAEEDLIGEDIDKVSKKFVQLAIDAGYIDVDTAGETVEFNVVVNNAEVQKTISDNVTNQINKCFDENGIFGQAKAKVLEIANNAELLGVTAYKYQLILTAKSLDPVKTIDELKVLNEKELCTLINGKVNEYKGIAADKMSDLVTRIQTLINNSKEMFNAEELIAELEEKIENSNLLTENAKELLKNQLADAKENYNTLKAAFEEAVQNIINQVKEESKTILENAKTQLNTLKQEAKAAIDAHKADFAANKEARLAEIKAWREAQNAQ